jgi:enoyl-CoA hydratase
MYKSILVTKDVATKTATVELNRPEALNALNRDLMTELTAAFRELGRDADVCAVVLTGSDKAFAAGADIKEMATATPVEMMSNGYLEMWDELQRFRKPIIAAVSGFVLGGGCELMMVCDIVIASETAKFGQPEINLGVIPGAGGTQRLARAVGKVKAMELILTGRFFDAKEAHELKLINKILPLDSYLAEAKKLAAEIASKPPVAAALAKETILKAENAGLDEGVEFERRLFAMLFSTADMREGMKAFIEKRKEKVVWQGK